MSVCVCVSSVQMELCGNIRVHCRVRPVIDNDRQVSDANEVVKCINQFEVWKEERRKNFLFYSSFHRFPFSFSFVLFVIRFHSYFSVLCVHCFVAVLDKDANEVVKCLNQFEVWKEEERKDCFLFFFPLFLSFPLFFFVCLPFHLHYFFFVLVEHCCVSFS